MLTEYPRPQFKREQWQNLNGVWDFAFDDGKIGEQEKWYHHFPAQREIVVPYSYEMKMSGIGDEGHHDVVWYHRGFAVEQGGNRVLLNFEGSDYATKVWVNGSCAGEHRGGYAAFALDITDYVAHGDNQLVVRVEDSRSCVQPRGKQRWKDENFGCWYVQTTGLWRPVWLEVVPESYIEKVKITPDIDNGTVAFWAKIKGAQEGLSLGCYVSLNGQRICAQQVSVEGEYVSFTLSIANEKEPWKLALWHPSHPHLYDVTLTLAGESGKEDKVETYFGMRKISIEGDRVLLNNLPIYQRLILDQGYWQDSGLTPPDDSAYEKDIDLILAAGYNGLRKHQKTEDRRFLYLCDQKGVLVWSEMAAQYTFNDDVISAFTREWMEVVEQNYNHPSVIVWTPFNESWGVEHIFTNRAQQRFTEAIYALTKAFDEMRPVIVNDGWEHTVSDIITLHDYEPKGEVFAKRYADLGPLLRNEIPFNGGKFAMAKGYSYKGQPVLISEYGGIALTSESGWGYGEQVTGEESFIARFDSITSAIREHPGICGFCYTQVTDVQQEVNGLYDMERNPKVNIERIAKINKR